VVVSLSNLGDVGGVDVEVVDVLVPILLNADRIGSCVSYGQSVTLGELKKSCTTEISGRVDLRRAFGTNLRQ